MNKFFDFIDKLELASVRDGLIGGVVFGIVVWTIGFFVPGLIAASAEYIFNIVGYTQGVNWISDLGPVTPLTILLFPLIAGLLILLPTGGLSRMPGEMFEGTKTTSREKVLFLLGIVIFITGFMYFMNHIPSCKLSDGCDPNTTYDPTDNLY